jgi:hypothetical protein
MAYNVKDCGALGNGIADDTAAIQTAVNAAYAAGGGIVYVPNGTYLIGGGVSGGLTGGIRLYSNVALIGEGKDATILKMVLGAYTGYIDIIYSYGTISGSTSDTHNISVANLTVDGTNQTPASGGIGQLGCGMDFYATDYLRVRDCKILNAGGYGIQIGCEDYTHDYLVKNPIVDGCLFQNNGRNGGGDSLAGGRHVGARYTNNRFEQCNGTAIDSVYPQYAVFANNTVAAPAAGGSGAITSDFGAQNCVIAFNTFEAGAGGIKLAGYLGGVTDGTTAPNFCTIIGNVIAQTSGPYNCGIEIDGSQQSNTNTTSGTVIPSVSSSVAVNVVSGLGFPNGSTLVTSDGAHAFTGTVTAGGGTTALTVECTAIHLGSAGSTVASGSVASSSPTTGPAQQFVIANNLIRGAYYSAIKLCDVYYAAISGNELDGWNASGSAISVPVAPYVYQATDTFAFHLRANVPGVSPGCQAISITGNMLRIASANQLGIYCEWIGAGQCYFADNNFVGAAGALQVYATPGNGANTLFRNNGNGRLVGIIPNVSTPTPSIGAYSYTNTGHVDQIVYVTGGTVSSITVNGQATGVTYGSFRLQQGGYMTVNNTSVPTVYAVSDGV